jgi:ATP-dependent Clp protease ATP-binding subunit ClpB
MIQEESGKNDYESIKSKLLDILEQHFKPEFLNRVDETVVFHPLTHEHIKAIAKIQLQTLSNRLKNVGYELTLGDSIYERVATVGFDPVFGARPLRRAIQNEIADPLSKLLLSGKLPTDKALNLEIDNDGKLSCKQLKTS